jgi:SAM-dependent methyltransferase
MYGRRETGFWHTIAQWIVEDAPRLGVQRCLDVGSGYGTVALFCQRTTGAPAYCLDVIPLLAPELIAAEGLTFAQRNVELAPIPWPGTFEIVTFTEVIEHLFYHPRVALKHIATALAPHGRLYLSTPDAREWGRVTRFYASPAVMPMPGDPLNPALGGHVYQYTMDELLEIVTEAGFVVERQGYSLGGANRHLNLTLRKVTA